MRAIIHVQSTQTLSFTKDEPIPEAPPGEYLIKNEAAGLTNSELLWPRPPDFNKSFPGVEAAGEVVKAPSGGKFKPGDKVYHRVEYPRGGGAREYSTVTEDVLALRPSNVTAEEAASIPVSALTAWQGLFEQAGLEVDFTKKTKHSSPRILINGASGGTGIWYVQLAHAAGYHVAATCSTRNIELVRSLGADEVIDYTTTSLPSKTFDLIFDNVRVTDSLWRALAPNGRLFTIAPQGAFEDFMNWNWELKVPEGASKGVKGRFFLMRADGEQLGKVTELVEERRCRGVVDGVWELEEFEGAFERCRSGRAVGKVVLRVGGE